MSHHGDLRFELARVSRGEDWYTYSGAKGKRIAPRPLKPYCATKVARYAQRVGSLPVLLTIKATMKGPTVNAIAHAAVNIPRRANGAICLLVSEKPQERFKLTYFSNIGHREGDECANGKTVDELSGEENRIGRSNDFKCNTNKGEDESNCEHKLSPDPIGDVAGSKCTEDGSIETLASRRPVMAEGISRCNGASTESGLPLSWQNVVTAERISKVLSKLRDTEDCPSSLVLKAVQYEDPDGVDTPSKSPGIFLDSSPFADLMLLLIGKKTYLVHVVTVCEGGCRLTALLDVRNIQFFRHNDEGSLSLLMDCPS
jgi:hypothetical protein